MTKSTLAGLALIAGLLTGCGEAAPTGDEVAPLVRDKWLVLAQFIQGKIDVSSSTVASMNCAQSGSGYACQGVIDYVGKKHGLTGISDFETKQPFSYQFMKGDKGWMLFEPTVK